MVTITLNITPPNGMTDSEALCLFCCNRGWTQASGETVEQFAKRVLAEDIKIGIQQQRRIEATAVINIPDDIIVE